MIRTLLLLAHAGALGPLVLALRRAQRRCLISLMDGRGRQAAACYGAAPGGRMFPPSHASVTGA